jgi:hypothetical protein
VRLLPQRSAATPCTPPASASPKHRSSCCGADCTRARAIDAACVPLAQGLRADLHRRHCHSLSGPQ